MSRQKTTFVVISLLLVTLGVIALRIGRRPTNICSNRHCFTMDSRRNFGEKEVYTDTRDAYRALFTSDTTQLRIEVRTVTSGTLQQEENAQVIRMKALFEKAPAPYPGDISDAIICDADHIPTYHEYSHGSTRLRYFVGFLNDRYTFGSCSDSEATYRGVLAYFSCPKTNSLIRVELFAPADEYKAREDSFMETIRSLDCAPR